MVGPMGDVSMTELLVNIALCAVTASVLQQVYVRYGRAISNRVAFARNFLVLTTTTMLIITIVQSSLALSLGLIGALSIVRFRAAIKEPEELAYLFLSIAVGLGFGANQRLVTLVAFVVIVILIRLRDLAFEDPDPWEKSAYLTITSEGLLSLDAIREVVGQHVKAHRIKRVDHTADRLEVFLLLEFSGADSLSRIDAGLRAKDEAVRLTFLDHRGGAVAV